ncbi:MAG TPA: nucleoside hydrolase [Lacisediminihabitans sp.]|uniref:nucleoside hydrolase n=1 Tax=Lacisediminihabitans sp. TaxID=2787631 RepID=UPI002ED89F34
MTTAAPRRLIIDTDVAMGAPGEDIDDGFALAFAVAEPRLRLELVTTVEGNTDVDSATVLATDLLRRLGRQDIPVIRGADRAILGLRRPRARQSDVLDRLGPPPPASQHAATAIVDHVMAHPDEVTLAAIGPLTNIATALAIEPGLADAIDEIVLMGGYFFGTQGNATVPGEFNIWADPEAAVRVLRSGARIRMVGLDVTYQVRMNRQQAAELAENGGEFGRFAGACGLGWIETLRQRYPKSTTHGTFHLHDPLAVAVVAYPELISWTDAHVDVALDGVARGVTIADIGGHPDERAPNALIARDVDAERFVALLLERLASV